MPGQTSSRAHPNLCPLNRPPLVAPQAPVRRAGRSESKNPRTHHHEEFRAALSPNMGKLLMKYVSTRSVRQEEFWLVVARYHIWELSFLGRSIRLRASH